LTQAEPTRVAVLGTGTMAPGIAAAFAAADFPVRIWGRRGERADAALAAAGRAAELLEREGLAASAAEIAARIEATDDLAAAVADAEVIAEAVAEDLAVKREVVARMEAVCAPDAMIATNTSGLRVSDIAAGARAPGRIVAMHFWNPAHLMPIVEVAGGEHADDASVDAAVALSERIGKVPVLIRNEVLGFLGVRMQQAVVREAIGLFEAGVASAQDIDLAVRTSFGVRFPVIGPLEAADLTGLDVIASIHRYLLDDLDRSTSPQRALLERVERGELGVKAGRGFHDWSERDPQELIARRDAELARRLRRLAQEGLIRSPSQTEAMNA
jgi:3-hydroxybutyryl-CoA dehydrogenase